MRRVAVAPGASVDANVFPLFGREPIDHPVVEVDETRKHLTSGPRIPRIVPAREPPLREVDRNAGCTSLESAANVLFAFVAEIAEELFPRAALHLAIERIEQGEHRWRNDRLLERLRRHLHRFLGELGCVGLVSEWPSRKTRQLPMMAIGEDGEILPVACKVIGEAGSGERVSQGIGSEA